MNYKIKNKTKKNFHKRFKKRHSKKITFKLYVGGDDENNKQNKEEPINQSTEIMDEVKKEREFNLGDSEILDKTSELAEGVAVKSIEGVGNLLGVDLSNPENTGEKLEEIKTALSDPKNKEKVKEIISEAADVGAVAIEAASPFITPLVEKSIDVGSNALSKMGESAVKIGLNTAEEIPGVGVLIGTMRSLSNAGEAVMAATNAAGEVVTASSDSINAATKNFERLMKEKQNSLNRINESVNKFTSPLNISQSPQLENLSNLNNTDNTTNLTTGGRNTRKKKHVKIYRKRTHRRYK
jgi:hypothetical protein